MRKLALAASLVLAALALAGTASAATWLTTASKAATDIKVAYANVEFSSCAPFTNKAVQAEYGAVSQVFPNGTRQWNVFVCGIGFTNGGFCAAVIHFTGQQAGAFRLNSYTPYRGCTPDQLRRITGSNV